MLFMARFAAAAIALIAIAAYYLLASIPFSYYHFIQVPQLPWLPMFILLHPLLLAAALAAIVPRPRTSAPALRPWIRYVALAGATAAVCMAAIEAMPVLQSYDVSAALVFVPVLLLTAAAALHVVAARADRGSEDVAASVDGASVARAAVAGFLVGVAYTAAAAGRGAAFTLGPLEFRTAAAISVAAHVACFTAGALVILVVRHASRRLRRGAAAERVAVAACAVVAGAIVIRRSLLTALILSDLRAEAIALALAVALVATVWAASTTGAPRPVERRRRWQKTAVLLAALIVLVAVLPPMVLLADWGGTLQKIMALAAWSASLSFVASAPFRGRRHTTVAAALSVVAVAAASTVVIATRGGVPDGHIDERHGLDLGVVVDRYATFDPSVAVLLEVFHPIVSDNDFFRTGRAAGDATDDRSLPAVPMTIADVQHRPAARPPHIFIVVVDSMRPDYLSAYNPAATFTPAIGAFAAESIVMRRAFTQYAGTALSQPAIWAGGLIQRAMYVKPFAAVDNLERLTVAAGYRRYVSVDPPLDAILEDWSGLVRLDSHLTHPEHLDEMYKFDLCSTVPELTGRIDRDGVDRPVFFYSQPQNLHIRALAGDTHPRDERATVPDASFFRPAVGASFFKPAVGALARIDGCFGRLIDYLKARRMYDDSIVVLTSDHGDAYGEAGRWGHAFYVAPEILRIPLIVHVPQKYLKSRVVDPERLALLTDVTPTLFDLAGYEPAGADGIAGRSLFPPSGASNSAAARGAVLVQSSYSRVYGLLDGDARWIYVADANRDREQFFDLTKSDPFDRPVAPADRPKYRRWLLDRMSRLDRFYGRPTQQ